MWNGKRYYSLDTYYKERFGHKVYKLSLNGGMTCPNRNGTLGTRGCIFCSMGGSGEFAAPIGSISDQLAYAKKMVEGKIKTGSYIAYFQSYTNTYEKIPYLRSLFTQAIKPDDIVGLSIATRPDCLNDEVLSLLAELNQQKPVFIELGLQTIHETTAAFIRRGYSISSFYKAVEKLSELGILIVVHVILGLPYETTEDMIETVDVISRLPIHGIKLQLLHILEETDLAAFYKAKQAKNPDSLSNIFALLDIDSYIDCLIRCIERIPPHIVLHRITGDGKKSLLLAPLWSADKKKVLNKINQEFTVRNSYQGKEWSKCSQKQECYIN